MRDYNGKTVYVGLDIHKKTYSVTCICDRKAVKKDTIIACPEKLIAYLNKYFVGAIIYTAYEAGFSGFCLHRKLIKNGIKNIVVHAASIEISARDRVKTDKRDSMKIAEQLTDGRLKCINIPDEERENFRSITRLREIFLKDRIRAGNQLKSLLYYHGLIRPDDETKISQNWIKLALKLNVADEIKYCIEMHANKWLDLNNKVKEIQKKLDLQAKKDKTDKIYRVVPGIGALSSRILANELGDMLQFKNVKGLFSFTGLTPSEHSSGEHRWLGHISHQGRSILRKTLVQCSWIAIKYDPKLNRYFEKLSKKTGKKRAIVAVARKLIGCIRTCFITGELYQLNRDIEPQKCLIN